MNQNPLAEYGEHVIVRGARVNNLKRIDVDVPLRNLVALTGVSGSGKSSLALGVLFAEGSRRYLEALSAYTRRRLSQAPRADVDLVEGIPAAVALHQRPTVPNVRSTFGTATELLNPLRLMYSRLGEHLCPNHHRVPPSIQGAATAQIVCPICGVVFPDPSAEFFSFNSEGACDTCGGTGELRQVNERSLVPDESRSIHEGAVAAWGFFGASFLPQVVAELGVRTNIPFAQLTAEERNIVLHGAETKRPIVVTSKNGGVFTLNATYRNANQVIDDAMHKAQSDKGMARLDRFVYVTECPSCGGSRLNDRARSSLLNGVSLDVTSSWPLDKVTEFVHLVPDSLPQDMHPMATAIAEAFTATSDRLLGLGLSYLSLIRASRTLSTGELQRVQLSRTVRSNTTGVLYVLDEPSIGLHPSNIDSLIDVVRELIDSRNSVVLVDHDVRVLRQADWLIELGPGAGKQGGEIVATGNVATIESDERSLIGDYLAERNSPIIRHRVAENAVFEDGFVHIKTAPHFTLHALTASFPIHRLTVVTGVSGSGKTTLVLDSLAASFNARRSLQPLPDHVVDLQDGGIDHTVVVDAAPIGRNLRSTVATYSGILSELRPAFAQTPEARSRSLKASDFSYNTGSLRCSQCDGTGQISLDVQFLPDVDIACPTCLGTRYSKDADAIALDGLTLPQTLKLTVSEARKNFTELSKVQDKLETLDEIGLGYLTLGEATPRLSGGEAQRLKLAADLHRNLEGMLFIFDEPSIGLHPRDIRVLLLLLQRLIDAGATVIVIEHDLEMIANADWIVDLGPGGGDKGGRIVAETTPEKLPEVAESVTGLFLKEVVDSVRPRTR